MAGMLLCAVPAVHADPVVAVQTTRRGADDAVEHERHRGDPRSVPVPPAAADAGQAQAGDSQAKALFEGKCSICHPLSRPLGRNMDRAGWTETVTRMQKVNGCPITDREAKTIIDYLAAVRGPAGK